MSMATLIQQPRELVTYYMWISEKIPGSADPQVLLSASLISAHNLPLASHYFSTTLTSFLYQAHQAHGLPRL